MFSQASPKRSTITSAARRRVKSPVIAARFVTTRGGIASASLEGCYVLPLQVIDRLADASTLRLLIKTVTFLDFFKS